MRAGLFGLLLIGLLAPGLAAAQQAGAVKGIVCSGPTPFHCAVFGAGFNKFYESFKGKSRPDQVVAAEFCASRNARTLSAKRRDWPGGPGNEVIVVDVTCAPGAVAERPAAPRPATVVRRESPPDFALRPSIQTAPDREERRSRRRIWTPERAAAAAPDEARPRERRRPARFGTDAEASRDRARRDERDANALRRERPAPPVSARPEPAERAVPVERPAAPETPKAPAAATAPETVKAEEPVEAKPAAAAKPANDTAAPAAAKPVGGGASSKRKRFEESLSYDHF